MQRPKGPPPKAKGNPKGKQPLAKPGARPSGPQDTAHRAGQLEAGKALQRLLDSAPGAKKLQITVASDAVRSVVDDVLALAEGLEVHVPVMPPVTRDDIKFRMDELRRAHAAIRPLLPGDKIVLGDEVELDATGYIKGSVFDAHVGVWFDVRANPFLPGLFETLVGAGPGDHRLVQVRLPKNYPVEQHAGKVAAFALDVKAALRRTLPDPKSPAFLEKIGKGKTLDAAMKAIENEIFAERGNQMVDHAKVIFLEMLYVQLAPEVGENAIEEELLRRWRTHIGDALIRQGVALDEQRASQLTYAQNQDHREAARRGVWEMQMLEAVADRAGITASDDELIKVLVAVGQQANARRSVIESVLKKNDAMHKLMLRNMRLQQALIGLLGKAKILFDLPPPEPPKPAPVPKPKTALKK